jgi:hypothetical protein
MSVRNAVDKRHSGRAAVEIVVPGIVWKRNFSPPLLPLLKQQSVVILDMQELRKHKSRL